MSDSEIVSEVVESAGESTEETKTTEPFLAFSSQEEVDKWIGSRLGKERDKARSEFEGYEDYKAAADELAQLKAKAAEEQKANLSEVERLKVELAERDEALAERDRVLAERETAIKEFESRQLRAEVAAKKGLPAALVAALTGATAEELEAHADELLKLIPQPVAGRPVEKDLRGGGNAGEDDDPGVTSDQLASRIISGLR